jgi:DNA-binding Lrp family transcriptional regulator
MEAIDRRIINGLQGGFPICERPYAAAAEELGLSEGDLISRLDALLHDGVLSRFGPMYRAERMGGDVTLAAMCVPDNRFDAVAEIVNSFDEVAHNYARDHALNMWFVIAADRRERIDQVVAEIEEATDLEVFDMPKIEEFFIGLRLEA